MVTTHTLNDAAGREIGAVHIEDRCTARMAWRDRADAPLRRCTITYPDGEAADRAPGDMLGIIDGTTNWWRHRPWTWDPPLPVELGAGMLRRTGEAAS